MYRCSCTTLHPLFLVSILISKSNRSSSEGQVQDICCTFLFVTEQNACRRSVGCILAELLQRKPLFPGKDYIDQLKLIIKTLGSPSDSDLSFINSQKAQQYIKALPKAQRVNFRAMYPDASPKSIDLMERMLQFDPRKRITVEEALQHPYLAQLHDPASEPSAPRAFVYDVEEDKLNEAGVRAAVYDEMTFYHPEALMKRL
ncbi:hypothetical protein ABBQ32_000591 [Trebouxia sp. C0010 RCD-2024]